MNTTNSNGISPTIKTLMQAVTYFSDLNAAHDFFAKMRWPDGPVCPRCGSKDVRYSPKYRRFECSHKHDRRQFTVKTGSVMEDSPLGLDKWAVAFWLEVNAKNSISSYEIHRALGITQKSAWFMLHRIRRAVKIGSISSVGGDGSAGYETDETYVGGLAKNMHRNKRKRYRYHSNASDNKAIVAGILERSVVENDGGKRRIKRHSKVIASVIETVDPVTLQMLVDSNIEMGSEIISDAHLAYRGLAVYYAHKIINHAERYVDGRIHTNGIENFWSLFKRAIKGSHVSVEPFHLQAYLDSEIFRFNHRETTDGERFRLAMGSYHGKRLTYKALIGAMESSPSSDNSVGNGSLPN